MARWHVITGEYPPQPGGVSDYTSLVARGLAEAGDEVHVWAPECSAGSAAAPSVSVHRLPGHFGFRALFQLERAFRSQPGPYRLLVQYVPHMYGWKAMNVPFCLWLFCSRKTPWVMFHEVAFPCARGQRLIYNALGIVHRLMAALVTRAAERIFVSVPAWGEILRRLASRQSSIAWLPVPSNVATDLDLAAVRTIRDRCTKGEKRVLVGHFGTFGGKVADELASVLPPLLQSDPSRFGLLIGRGSTAFADRLLRQDPSLKAQLHATGELTATEVAAYLGACDLLVQPYPDGVSTRRTTVMAGLALGIPIVTCHGPATEPVWHKEGLVALAPAGDPTALRTTAEGLLADSCARQLLGERGRAGYAKYFSLDHTIRALRTASYSRA